MTISDAREKLEEFRILVDEVDRGSSASSMSGPALSRTSAA